MGFSNEQLVLLKLKKDRATIQLNTELRRIIDGEKTMNYVSFKRLKHVMYRISDLTGDNFSSERTAFIGSHEEESAGNLYLITPRCVILAGDPTQTWTPPDCVFVRRFVDVRIMVLG